VEDKKEIEDRKALARYVVNKILDGQNKMIKEAITNELHISAKEFDDKFEGISTRIIKDLDEQGRLFAISDSFLIKPRR
jgi:hypothetical protein